jgi:hypothetical protein
MNTIDHIKGSATEKIFEGSAYTRTSHFGHFLKLIVGKGGRLIRGSAYTRVTTVLFFIQWEYIQNLGTKLQQIQCLVDTIIISTIHQENQFKELGMSCCHFVQLCLYDL